MSRHFKNQTRQEHDQIRHRIGSNSEKLLNNLSYFKQDKTTKKEVTKMREVKCCPKCGSTNINFLVFYRPSVWKCLDCGYEGAFIIKDSEFGDKMQERYLGRCNTINRVEREPHTSNWDHKQELWKTT